MPDSGHCPRDGSAVRLYLASTVASPASVLTSIDRAARSQRIRPADELVAGVRGRPDGVRATRNRDADVARVGAGLDPAGRSGEIDPDVPGVGVHADGAGLAADVDETAPAATAAPVGSAMLFLLDSSMPLT
jgi:hypothetical protein